ncbi:hypothetical protein PILCRDRAFT_87769 [Piloderma croceum F 1598]|uniref:MYND-type domain-containing protein n=1 Tax=Piloderma croceum (strain F 1598) TaxID=765440 RepID=A0A0C3G129_PILCF|nr:hypothetical protein PILCRDRAFT_87769 [Piloderma croceum F 1598]
MLVMPRDKVGYQGCDCTGADLKKCTKCTIVKYCSQECQVSDWPVHKVIYRTPPDDAKHRDILSAFNVLSDRNLDLFGSISYYALLLHLQPDANKHTCMVVQLGFESICATKRADSFDCISIKARPIDVVLPDHRADEEKYNPTKELILKQI